MKKYILLLLLPFLAILNSCQKMDGVVVSKNGSTTTTGSTGSTGSTGTTTGNTYQPVTANSYWKYTATTTTPSGTTTGHSVTTMNGTTSTINSKLYYANNNTSDLYTGTQIGYYSVINHVYTLRSTTIFYGITIDMAYLNDAVAVGTSSTTKMTDDGLVNGVPGQLVTTLVETGISKTVNSKSFSNVMHTKLVVQYNYGQGNGYENAAVYDFYAALNVGIIEIDSDLSASGAAVTGKTILTDYLIK